MFVSSSPSPFLFVKPTTHLPLSVSLPSCMSFGIFKYYLSYLTCMGVCLHMCLCMVCVPGALWNCKSIGSLDLGLWGRLWVTMWAQELSLGPLQAQSVPVSTEPSLQPADRYFITLLHTHLTLTRRLGEVCTGCAEGDDCFPPRLRSLKWDP